MRQIIKLTLGIAAQMLLVFCILVGTLVMMACSNQYVASALGDAAAGAHSIATTAAGAYGANDPRTIGIQKWAQRIDDLKADYKAATTPDEQVKLLPTLQFVLNYFTSDVLPLFSQNPTVLVILAAVDAGLRIAANHFLDTADSVSKKLKKMKMSIPPEQAGEIRDIRKFLETPKVKSGK